MEYVQMTLDDWVQMKQKLRQELIGVKQSFVRIEAKMNFGTIYYLDQIGGSKLGRRIDKLEKIGKATDSDKMNFAAKLIYAMVRSNGRKVTFDEALQLVPPDPTELADTVAPLITKITELVAGLIEEFNQLSPEGQRVIAGCVLVVAAVGPVFSIISKVSGGVSSLIGIISKIAPVLGPIKTGFAAVNAVMAANPILIIIAAVAALIAIFVTLYNKCEWFRDGVNDIFGAVANFIKGAIDKIKGFFDFDWKLPKIKLPHFKASGEWSLSPLKVPKISVDWYANGGILNSPTIFGANGDSLMGGGEAGKEAVLPIKLLKDYIREENDANNATLAAMIVEAFKSISMTAENNIYIGDKKSITLLTNLVLKQMANKTLATQGAKGK